VKAYFFKITPHNKGEDTFDKCLEYLYKHRFDKEGHYEECDGVSYRIERFKRAPDVCMCDFVKQQTDGLPPFAQRGKPLKPNDVPLGHLTAILFHMPTQILVIESNRNGAQVGSIVKFIREHCAHGGFEYLPILNNATVDELLNGPLRRVTVRFAAPDNLQAVAGDGGILNQLNNMRSMFGGPSMEISCGFDSPKKGNLRNKNVVKFIRELYGSPLSIQKIQAKSEDSAEMLDLLGKKLVYHDPSAIRSNDIAKDYNTRRMFLAKALNDNADYIKKFFVKQ
jgi:hypothetical protein